PELRIRKYAGVFCLVDTRGLPGCRPVDVLDAREARRLVVSELYDDSPEQRSLIRRKLALRLDGHFVPLAVADQSIFTRLNEAAVSTRRGGQQHVGAWAAHPDGAGRAPVGQFRSPSGPASLPPLAVSRAPAAL